MLKRICAVMVISLCVFIMSGCALVGTALSAAAAYGVYQATRK